MTTNFQKINPQTYCIDNWMFKLHYQITTLIFLACSLLVTLRQFLGEPIQCIVDKEVPKHVMKTFCFYTTPFTVVKPYEDKILQGEYVAHPGVGSYGFNSTEPIQRHAYYQWVPLVLFGQAIMFLVTHLLWKHWEGGHIRRLLNGLQLSAYVFLEKEVEVVKVKKITPKEEKAELIEKVCRPLTNWIYVSKSWSLWLVICEILNVLNVLLQFYITNEFLSQQFLWLGFRAVDAGFEQQVTVLDEVFPKVTKCTFPQYGPFGTIQLRDAICVMPLNITNEKIYVLLWFWFIFLFCLSLIALFWRFLTFVFHARSERFNKMAFAISCPGKLERNMLTVMKRCNFTDWLFLKYLLKNMDCVTIGELLQGLIAKENKNFLKSVDSDEENEAQI